MLAEDKQESGGARAQCEGGLCPSRAALLVRAALSHGAPGSGAADSPPLGAPSLVYELSGAAFMLPYSLRSWEGFTSVATLCFLGGPPISFGVYTIVVAVVWLANGLWRSVLPVCHHTHSHVSLPLPVFPQPLHLHLTGRSSRIRPRVRVRDPQAPTACLS